MIGLVITDLSLFTERLKKTSEAYSLIFVFPTLLLFHPDESPFLPAQDYKEGNLNDTGDVAEFMAQCSQKMIALSMELSEGKITTDQYMNLQQEIQVSSSPLTFDLVPFLFPKPKKQKTKNKKQKTKNKKQKTKNKKQKKRLIWLWQTFLQNYVR